jgi:alpha-tubulin suppressor-like RCC1 family protein
VIAGLNGISSVVAPFTGAVQPNFAIATDGSVRGWGFGILGASVTGFYGEIVDTPILVPAAGQATALSVCHGLDLPIVYALHSDGTVSYTPATSRIGPGPTRTSTTQTVSSLTSVISMSEDCIGVQPQTVVVKSDGTVWSLTLSSTGDVGPPPFSRTTTYHVVVAQVIGLPAITQVSCGGGIGSDGFCLARATDGTVWAWGENGSGQLGDGTLIGRTIPIQVPGLASIAKVIAVSIVSYAIDTNGGVFSWGGIALGRTINNIRVPGRVILPAAALALAGSGFHAVVLLSNGTVWSWGSNTWGELGDGTSGSTPSVLPIQALGLNLN